MTNRKKRLKKGIESLDKQIKLHEEKLIKAKVDGMAELENYYQKEIKSLKQRKKSREKFLER
jgi:flagellar capping protein FliD